MRHLSRLAALFACLATLQLTLPVQSAWAAREFFLGRGDISVALPDSVIAEIEEDAQLQKLESLLIALGDHYEQDLTSAEENPAYQALLERTVDTVFHRIYRSPYQFNRKVALVASYYHASDSKAYLEPLRAALEKKFDRFKWERRGWAALITVGAFCVGGAICGGVGAVIAGTKEGLGGVGAAFGTFIVSGVVGGAASVGTVFTLMKKNKLLFSAYAVNPRQFFESTPSS